MSTARSKLPLILVGVVLAALVLLSWTRVWFTVSLNAEPKLDVDGSSAAPGLAALGLAALALVLALTIARRGLRVILGIVESIIGGLVLSAAVAALADPINASAATITSATALAGPRSVRELVVGVDPSVWAWVAAIVGALLMALGAAIALLSPRWRQADRKYAPDSEAATDASSSAIGTWDSLSGGSDPTGQEQTGVDG